MIYFKKGMIYMTKIREMEIIPQGIDKEVQEIIAVSLHTQASLDFISHVLKITKDMLQDKKDMEAFYTKVSEAMMRLIISSELVIDYVLDTDDIKKLEIVMDNIYEIYNSTFVQTLFLTKSDIDEFKISMKNIKDQYLENNEEEIDVMRKCIRTSMKILFTSLNNNSTISVVMDYFPSNTTLEKLINDLNNR